MNWSGGNLTREMLAALGQANMDNAAHLANEGALQTPVDKGDLKGSLEPGDPDGRWQVEAGGLNVTVGSNLPYAAKQHEDLSLHHDNGKAKYLEDPLNANRDRYMRRLADAAREVLSK